jgi:flagellar FliJ protein
MEKILDWRIKEEENARKSVLHAQNQMQQQQQQLTHLINENTKLKHEQMKLTEISTLRYNHHLKGLIDEKIVIQKNAIDQAQSDMDRLQEAFLQAHKDRKIMEKLKERESVQVLEQVKSEEQKQLDEIATLQYKTSYF